MKRLAFGPRNDRMYQSRVCYPCSSSDYVGPTYQDVQLDLRLWVIREGKSALFPFKCRYSSCSCPSSIAMCEHLLVYIFTKIEILFFGNPYCLIKMVYCKDVVNVLHGFYIIAGISALGVRWRTR